MAVGNDPRVGDRPVGHVGDQFLGEEFCGHHDGVPVDRGITVEEPAEVFEVAETDQSPFELGCVEHADIEESLPERDIADPLGEVDDAVVEVGEYFGVVLEGDLASERLFPGIVERHPDGLWPVDDQRSGVDRVGRCFSVVDHFRQPPPCCAPSTRGASGGFRPRPPGRSRGRSVGTARRPRRRAHRENAPIGPRS